MPKTFNVGIKGLIVKEGKILMVRATDQQGKNFWDIPGGRIDEGETIEQTIMREISEELGYSLDEVGVKEVVHAYRLDRDLKDGNGLMLIFVSLNLMSGKEPVLSEEAQSYEWLTVDDIKALSITTHPYINEGYKHAALLALQS